MLLFVISIFSEELLDSDGLNEAFVDFDGLDFQLEMNAFMEAFLQANPEALDDIAVQDDVGNVSINPLQQEMITFDNPNEAGPSGLQSVPLSDNATVYDFHSDSD